MIDQKCSMNIECGDQMAFSIVDLFGLMFSYYKIICGKRWFQSSVESLSCLSVHVSGSKFNFCEPAFRVESTSSICWKHFWASQKILLFLTKQKIFFLLRYINIFIVTMKFFIQRTRFLILFHFTSRWSLIWLFTCHHVSYFVRFNSL